MRQQNVSTDEREQLFNDRMTGPAQNIALPKESITRLHGILLDLDPKHFIPGNALFPPDDDPERFFEKIRPALDRHPLARDAEVRVTGTGLHGDLWIEPAVELHSAAEQDFWAAVVKAVQLSLPGDPSAPGITALTRPIGSTNSKNGAKVRRLRAGQPVTADAVLAYVGRLREMPFRCLAEVLLGPLERISPCPICKDEEQSMVIFDGFGKCYSCNKITWERLINEVMAAEETASARKARGQKLSTDERGRGAQRNDKSQPKAPTKRGGKSARSKKAATEPRPKPERKRVGGKGR